MPLPSPAPWAFGRPVGTLSASSALDQGVHVPLRRILAWAAPAGAAIATLAVAAGAAFGDRPTVFVALVALTTVVAVFLLCQGLAARILARLDDAVSERDRLETELHAAHRTKEEFRNLAYHDALTGLPNRSLLHDRLGLAIEHAHRQASHLAVLFLDLDDFKVVNDSFGHTFGDRFLVELATRLRSCVRGGDTVARFGGDEFVVLLDNVTGAEDAAHVATKVRSAVQAPFRHDDHEVSIAASIGVSVYPGNGSSPDELLTSADANMYRDKQGAPPTPSSEVPGAIEAMARVAQGRAIMFSR
jgi:diguanylate cyclase (GGDEF)-like protein